MKLIQCDPDYRVCFFFLFLIKRLAKGPSPVIQLRLHGREAPILCSEVDWGSGYLSDLIIT